MAIRSAFGKNPSGARLKRVHASPNYSKGSFQNLVPAQVILPGTLIKMAKEYFFRKPIDTVPSHPIPSVFTDLRKLPSGAPSIVWFGRELSPRVNHFYTSQGVGSHAKILLPVHWTKFALALHPWDEPIKRIVKAAAEKGLPLATPLIGQPVILGSSLPQTRWWQG